MDSTTIITESSTQSSTSWTGLNTHIDMADRINNTKYEMNRNQSDRYLESLLNEKGSYFDNKLAGQYVLIIVLCVLAIVTNLTILTAIRHIRRRLSANQTMMFSLCCADLLTSVGFLIKLTIEQKFYYVTVPKDQQPAAMCVYKIVQAIVFAGHNATLCNLLCLAVDHYCAIAKPLTYSLFMSKRRVHIVLAVLWMLSVLFGFSDFLMPGPAHGHCDKPISLYTNYCERVICTEYEPDHITFCVVLVCFIMMTVLYSWIVIILYRYQQQSYATVTQRKAKRNKRGLITSFIILGLFAILWLPHCILDAYVILKMDTTGPMYYVNIHKTLFWYLYALVVFNALCDPIVYALRMREIQDSLKMLLCFKRPKFNTKMSGFGEALRQNSSSTITLKNVQRQYSNNTASSVSTAAGSGAGDKRTSILSRKGTLSSQASDITEDTPLNKL